MGLYFPNLHKMTACIYCPVGHCGGNGLIYCRGTVDQNGFLYDRYTGNEWNTTKPGVIPDWCPAIEMEKEND